MDSALFSLRILSQQNVPANLGSVFFCKLDLSRIKQNIKFYICKIIFKNFQYPMTLLTVNILLTIKKTLLIRFIILVFISEPQVKRRMVALQGAMPVTDNTSDQRIKNAVTTARRRVEQVDKPPTVHAPVGAVQEKPMNLDMGDFA